jgi:hypothetical protein
MLQFGSAAKVAGFDILTYVARHLWPPVVASNQSKSFESTRVTSNVSVMVLFDNHSAKLVVLWDIDLSLKQHQPLRF